MDLSIFFESSIQRRMVVLHAWQLGGRVWDIPSTPNDAGLFHFTISEATGDPRKIHFKFRFPDERIWEGDEYERSVPTRRATTFWTFDQSPRITTRDPYAAQVPDRVQFFLYTKDQFRGGRLLIWLPETEDRIEFDEASRDNGAQVSVFDVVLLGWMRRGFHFKWVTSEGKYEGDRQNRVWRPGDGDRVFVKSGQVGLHTVPLRLMDVSIRAIYPASLRQPPKLKLSDCFDQFASVLAVGSAPKPLDSDPRFYVAEYPWTVYPRSSYSLSAIDPPLPETHRLPIRVSEQDTGPALQLTLVVGDPNWLNTPLRSAPVRLVFSPRRDPDSPTGLAEPRSLQFALGVDAAPPYDTVPAVRQDDGTWSTKTYAPVNVPLYSELVSPTDIDRRLDGPISSRRAFFLTDTTPVQLNTAGGIGGYVATPWAQGSIEPHKDLPAVDLRTVAPRFPEVAPAVAEPPPGRKALMVATFGPQIANANIFDPDEMPLGPTQIGSDIYFVIVAPHAMDLKLVLLSDSNVRSVHPMTRTADNRYYWCVLPAANVPHGQRYRFLQNNNLEVLDPAARWAFDPSGSLLTNVGDGINAAWSRYADATKVSAPLKGDTWGTQPFETLFIYKLHAQRFTNRNPGSSQGFDQVTAELAPGKYLHNLGVTALEFLPLAEFDTGSWGYNPSLFFAIQSRYGGPEALARCAAAAHAANTGIMMDLIFNHYFDSPLEGLASDVYVDGLTAWGSMVNFDNPICMQFFRQTILYLWNTFRLDGFRFDCTLAMAVETGTWPGVVLTAGSGGGRNFLNYLRAAVRRAADVTGRRWPYFDGENDPNFWDLTNNSFGGILDGQWAFNESYPLGQSARNQGDDQSYSILDSLGIPISWGRPFCEAVRFAESQDTCGNRGFPGSQVRIARRPPFGQGFQMAKAMGTIVALADGVPMVFMGQEGGEDNDFYFDFFPADQTDPTKYARLNLYETLGDDHNRIFAWFRDLIGLRNNPLNGLQGNDFQTTGRGYKTVAFTRSHNRFFVVASFGTTDNRQTLSWLGLPSGSQYKEIFNSSWPEYQVVSESNYTNGGYDAALLADTVINIPPIGGIILERIWN
jgi:1,4-alpha-glucan branching enzyme